MIFFLMISSTISIIHLDTWVSMKSVVDVMIIFHRLLNQKVKNWS